MNFKIILSNIKIKNLPFVIYKYKYYIGTLRNNIYVKKKLILELKRIIDTNNWSSRHNN
jgi:hypothetical protein